MKPLNSILELKTVPQSNDVSQTELACYNRSQKLEDELVSGVQIQKHLRQQSESGTPHKRSKTKKKLMIQSSLLKDMLKNNKKTIDLDYESYRRLEKSQSPLKTGHQSILRNASIMSAKTLQRPTTEVARFVDIKKKVSFANNMIVFSYHCQ